MPLRKVPLVTNEIYHIFNRTVANEPLFTNVKEYKIFVKTIEYYSYVNTPFRFSHYLKLNNKEKQALLNTLYQNKKLVEIYSYCLMPNHYHLLVKQLVDKGISNYMRFSQNSYAKYLNLKKKRNGAVFQSPFKAVRIETGEQFMHVARYIHLNPFTGFVIDSLDKLKDYEWSSYKDYLGKRASKFLVTNYLKSFYKNNNEFEQFVLNQADYQRKIKQVKHLIPDVYS